MPRLLYVPGLVLLAAACSRRHDPPGPDSLAGTWKLTALQCYCAPGVPSETLVLKADSTFEQARAGQPGYTGTYATSRRAAHPGQLPQPWLTLRGSTSALVYYPSGAYTLSGNTLTIATAVDNVADAPVYTYQRSAP